MNSRKRGGSARWSSDQRAVILFMFMRWQARYTQQNRLVYERTWQRWREYDELRKSEMDQAERAVLKATSLQLLQRKRPNSRTDSDRRVIGKWLQTLVCLPKMDSRSVTELASGVEVMRCPANTLIILQGEFGNCCYMIAFGAVALYVEDNHDKELANFRDYAKHRARLLPVSGETLGRHVLTLSEGNGFGELAVIATTYKIRSASAVSVEDSCLLVVQGPLYMSTIHPFSKAQERISSAMQLLKQHPISKTLSLANIASLAYEMQKQTRQRREVIVRTGHEVTSLYLIEDGFVKAHDKRGIGASLLGHGCMIGESEWYNEQPDFALTYTADTRVNLYELPLTMYRKVVKRAHQLGSVAMKAAMKPVQARQLRIAKGREQIESLTARKPKARSSRDRGYTIESIIPLLRYPQRPRSATTASKSRGDSRSPRVYSLSARQPDPQQTPPRLHRTR